MAQTEDTELQDLVIEALDKNGSLAKIRALLRANIFLAFEDEFENIKQNIALDSVLKTPEGNLSLSIVHEFLEFCNLKNTLFVYMSESRQGKEYTYDGQRLLNEKLDFLKREVKEPILVTVVKNLLKSYGRKYCEKDDNCNINKPLKLDTYKDEQNCTYIVHEDSSNSSLSHSDNSSDEKNKLHLRLHLENSDTDTSSDSARDKTSSEYVPNDHIILTNDDNKPIEMSQCNKLNSSESKNENYNKNITSCYLYDLKTEKNNSSDSTSYIDLKPFNNSDTKNAINNLTSVNMNVNEENKNEPIAPNQTTQLNISKAPALTELSNVSPTSASSSYVSSISLKDEKMENIMKEASVKSELSPSRKSFEAEYSYDFTSTPISSKKDSKSLEKQPELLLIDNEATQIMSAESPHLNSQSSQSSVSISDVAELIEYSLRNSPSSQHNSSLPSSNESRDSIENPHEKVSDFSKKLKSVNSDFSESPIPSLSNLSLDIHSD